MPIAGAIRELLHNRRFRLLCGGYLASALTDGLIPIVFTIETLRVSGFPWALPSVLIALLLGRFLVIPLSGRLAATQPLLHVMIGADLIRIGAQAGLVIFIAFAANSTTAMAISAFAYGLGVGLYMPAQQTTLPSLVSSAEIEKANAALSAVTDVSFIAGPALGVAAIHLVGFSGALVLDCVTFAINIAALLRLVALCRAQRIDVASDSPPEASDAEGTLRTAWRLARTDRFLGLSLAFWTIASIFIGMVAVYAPRHIIGTTGDARTWAAIATVMAVSSLAGSVSAAIGSRLPYRFGVMVVAALLVSEFAAVALVLHRDGRGTYLILAVFGAGALMTTWTGIQWTSAVQRRLLRSDMGRFFAVESALTAIAIPAGMALAPLVELGGGVWLLVGLGSGLLAAATALARTPERSIDYATA